MFLTNFILRSIRKIFSFLNIYRLKCKKNVYDIAEVCEQIKAFKYKPLISIITPIYNPDFTELKEYFKFILNENIYSNIELCLIVDGNENIYLSNYLNRLLNEYPDKIVLIYNNKCLGISQSTQKGILAARGEYICFIDQDDIIDKYCFFEIVKSLQEQLYDYIYTDENQIDSNGKEKNWNFKPNYSPHTLLSRMYTNHLSVYRKEVALSALPLSKRYDGCQDYYLILKCWNNIYRVKHINCFLYHWRQSRNSICNNPRNKSYIYERAETLIHNFLRHYDLNAVVRSINKNFIYSIKFIEKIEQESILFIITGKIDYLFLEHINNFIREITSKLNLNIELCIFTNEDFPNKNLYNVKVRTKDLNLFIKRSNFKYLMFLNTVCNISSITSCLKQMIPLLKLPYAGIISPCLLDKKNFILKSGCIFYDYKMYFPGRGLKYGESDYYGINYSLVNHTIANEECFLLNKEVYVSLGGLKEYDDFTLSFIDYSLKMLRENKYSIVNNNCYVKANKNIHLTGYDLSKKLNFSLFIKEWRTYIKKDYFYNKNFSVKYNRLFVL